MHFITIVCNTYSCNILIDVQCLHFLIVWINGCIFSGVPPLEQFLKFTLDAVILPVENTTLMVALFSLNSWPQRCSHFTAVRKCEYTYTSICVSHITASCVLSWWGYGKRSLWWPGVVMWLLTERRRQIGKIDLHKLSSSKPRQHCFVTWLTWHHWISDLMPKYGMILSACPNHTDTCCMFLYKLTIHW